MNPNPAVMAVARAICLAEFGNEEEYGETRCCQVGGTEGCCLDTVIPIAQVAIAAYLNAVDTAGAEDPDEEAVGRVVLTRELLHAGKTGTGGYNARQIKALGLRYPPKKGWLSRMIGRSIPLTQYDSFLELRTGNLTKPPSRPIKKKRQATS